MTILGEHLRYRAAWSIVQRGSTYWEIGPPVIDIDRQRAGRYMGGDPGGRLLKIST
jgi:hypothetical protein